MSDPIRAKLAYVTHRGCVRQANEDCIGALSVLTAVDQTAPHVILGELREPTAVVVADGLGGHRGGRFASEFVCRNLMTAAKDLTTADELDTAIRVGNKELYKQMDIHPDLQRMGATLAGILITRGELYGFNVGDSRIYEMVPGPYLRLLSVDDVPKGPDYDVSTRTGLTSHVVTQCLGGTSSWTDIAPHIASRPLVSGSIFLMCSDGLTDMLDQDEIENCIDPEIGVFAERLFQKALAAGGQDNVSICILEIL